GTTISPWVVTLDALEPFLVEGPRQNPTPLPYLEDKESGSYDVELEVSIKPEKSNEETVVCKSNLKHMYWTFKQQLAHHTINGCNMRPGDLCGTGTISGPTKDSFGSMLELSWNGQNSVTLKDGSERTFLEDGDLVTIRGMCKKGEIVVGFGSCSGKIIQAK
ncbi:hypothetical protein ROZALSC1DRAFT_17932, partial [Rozella allomycis CSF55]